MSEKNDFDAFFGLIERKLVFSVEFSQFRDFFKKSARKLFIFFVNFVCVVTKLRNSPLW